MTSLSPAEVIRGVDNIATLPDIYWRLEEEVESPRASFEEIGNIILTDPGLAARILRLANSAFFGHRPPINSIYTAIYIIGTQQLKQLALATIVLDKFKHIKSQHLSMKLFWQHSL